MATENAIYKHHERTLTADLEADLQLREIGIDPVLRMLTAYSEVLNIKIHGVTEESPSIAFDGAITIALTLGVTGVQTNASDLVLSAANALIRSNTSDGSDNKLLVITGGGAGSGTRGATIQLYGNENASLTGVMRLIAGDVSGSSFQVYTGSTERLNISHSGVANFTGAVTMASTLGVTGVVTLGTGTPTFATKRLTVIGNSFDNTSIQFENTDVNTVANGRAFNLGITDVSGTSGRLDLTQPGERTVLSVFSNGRVGIGSTTDGGEQFQVTGTSRFTGAGSFASTLGVTGTLTAAAINASAALTVSTGVSSSPSTITSAAVDGDTSFYVTNTATSGSGSGAGILVLNYGYGDSKLSFAISSSYWTMGSDISDSNAFVICESASLGTNNRFRIDEGGMVTIGGTITATGGVTFGNSGATTCSYFRDGSFTGTLTGVSGSVTGTFYFTRIGNAVTLYIPALQGTSNATSCTITGLPAYLTPTTNQQCSIPGVLDNSEDYPGYIFVLNTSVLGLYYRDAIATEKNVFTASGTKGIYSQCAISYQIV